MPEALAVVAVLVVTLIAWVGALLHARDPANHNGAAEVARLRHHAAWLEQRLERAQREGWGSDMIRPLSDEIAAVSAQLQRVSASSAVETC